MNQYIVLDIETTGLDCTRDKIIEIGAVKVSRGLITAQFSSLINPQIPVPEEITQITGINDQMLIGQPLIEDVIADLESFIQDNIVVAHNAPFDYSFVSPYWDNGKDWIDTVLLAQIVFPSANGYSLAKLIDMLGIKNTAAHRSLGDAVATAELFITLIKELSSLPQNTKKRLALLAKEDQTSLGDLIRNQVGKNAGKTTDLKKRQGKAPITEKGQRNPVLLDSYILDETEVESYFQDQGFYRQRLDDFEYRPQQMQMALAVTQAYNSRQHLLVEAGTGTGKSLAYLLPSVLFALGSGYQVAISTHTINLQEQLLQKDIPMLKKIINQDFKAVVLKGRNNYLCLRLYDSFCANPGENLRYFLMRIAVWLEDASDGDGGKLNLGSFDKWKWALLAASKENCAAPHCRYCKGACFINKTRKEAEDADLFILNHALLAANTSMENGFLPMLPYLVIDEAHHLEKAAEEQLTQEVNFYSLLVLLGRLHRFEKGQATGALELIAKQTPSLFWAEEERQEISGKLENLNLILEYAIKQSELFFALLKDSFSVLAAAECYYPAKIKLDSKIKQTVNWVYLQEIGKELTVNLHQLSRQVLNLLDLLLLTEIESDQELSGKEELKSIGFLLKMTADLLQNCLDLTPDEAVINNYVYWVQLLDEKKVPSLHMAPIEIGELLKDRLFSDSKSVILTSATMAASDSFTFFKKRLGLDMLEDSPKELILPSPFYYSEQALFTVCNDLPDWNQTGELVCRQEIAKAIITLVNASQGRAIVLFTSHQQLKSIYQMIQKPLAQQGITVLAHGISGNPTSILGRFKQEGKCCILGANSFWEGIDVVGSMLSLVIVVRLPFWPPNTPTSAARMERLEAQGKSGFQEYSLPQALIRFKQGFGRLIRSGEDKGAFCVLDRRIFEKKYGRYFVKCLPEMETIFANCKDVAIKIERWLDEG